jgi:hypothetical protein
MRRADHVVIDCRTSEMHCSHCGHRQPLALPMSLDLVLALQRAYLKQHKDCRKPEASPR